MLTMNVVGFKRGGRPNKRCIDRVIQNICKMHGQRGDTC